MNSTINPQCRCVLPDISWKDKFTDYLQNEYRKIVHHQLSAKSIKLAIQHIRVFSLWYEAKFNQPFEPGTLTNYDLHVYRKFSLEEEKVKAATWNSRHWALGILCLWAGQPDLMDCIEQKEAGRASTKHRSLTEEEYHRLMRLIERDTRDQVLEFHYRNSLRNRSAVALMLHAGLRVEEVSLTAYADVTINERSGNIFIRNGKGCKERNVPLNKMARIAISPYMELKSEGSFFNLTTRSLQRIVSDIGHRIGVPDLTPHWLRYTFAKRLENSGATLEAIRDLLGHKSIEVTRRYLRSSMEELMSAVESMDN